MTRRSSSALMALSFLALAAAPAAVEAQSTLGVLGGADLSTFSGDDDAGANHEPGFLFGVFGQFPLGEVLAFRPEVTYVQKGASFDNPLGESFDLSYIEVPLLLRIGMPRMARGVHALAGPTMAFEVGCDTGRQAGGVAVTVDCDQGGASNRKSFVVGFQVGGGIDVPLSMALLSLDGRYTLDMESFLDESAGDLANRVLAITASLGFPLGR